jgi:hypothetical protein
VRRGLLVFALCLALAGCGSERERPAAAPASRTPDCATQAQTMVALAKSRGTTLSRRERRMLHQLAKAGASKHGRVMCASDVDSIDFAPTP